MRTLYLFVSGAIMSASFLGMTESSTATVLLNLIAPPAQTDTAYSLPFIAVDPMTTVTIAGYNVHAFEFSTNNGVFLGGAGPNLLGLTWELTPAADGGAGFQVDNGGPVNDLEFGGIIEGDYDAFSQTFATTPGSSYTLELLYTNPDSNDDAGFLVTTTGTTASVALSPTRVRRRYPSSCQNTVRRPTPTRVRRGLCAMICPRRPARLSHDSRGRLAPLTGHRKRGRSNRAGPARDPLLARRSRMPNE
jgi:hypothetical protein